MLLDCIDRKRLEKAVAIWCAENRIKNGKMCAVCGIERERMTSVLKVKRKMRK